MGAAICWLLDNLYPDGSWQEQIEKEISLTEFLIRIVRTEEANLEFLNIPSREQQEQISIENIKADANRKIENLMQNGAIMIKYPDNIQVFKSFSPRSIISLGDGRIIHQEFVVFQTPNGQIDIKGKLVLENITEGWVMFGSVPYQIKGNRIEASTETVKILLENVRQTQDGIILLM